MTNAKLLEKLRNLTKNTEKADKEHIKKLRKVLHKLKKRKQKLADDLKEVGDDHDRQRIEQEIEVLQLQRKKGVEIYKRLKSGSSSESATDKAQLT
jgi:hypothetical protein